MSITIQYNYDLVMLLSSDKFKKMLIDEQAEAIEELTLQHFTFIEEPENW